MKTKDVKSPYAFKSHLLELWREYKESQYGSEDKPKKFDYHAVREVNAVMWGYDRGTRDGLDVYFKRGFDEGYKRGQAIERELRHPLTNAHAGNDDVSVNERLSETNSTKSKD